MFYFTIFKKQSNSLKIIRLILCLGLFGSCKTEEDRYPELQMFDKEGFSENVLIEEASFYEELITDTKDYIYTYKLNTDNYTKELVIRDQEKNKKLEIELHINTYVSVDPEGNVYYSDHYNQKLYGLTPPLFNKKEVQKKKIDYYLNTKMIVDNEEEMKVLNLTIVKGESNEAYYNYLENKINEYLEKNVLQDYKNIFMSSEGCIFRYKDGSEYFIDVFRKYFHEYPKGLNIIEENKSDFTSSDFYNKNNSLIEFDNPVTLTYTISEGNHFVPGIKSHKLYYYELKIGNTKSIKFKSESKLTRELSFDNSIVVDISNEFKNYKITIP